MRLKVVLAPDPVLKTVAEPVTEFDAELKKLAADMLDTMYAAHGIGLAANQIAVLKRILVMDTALRRGESNPMVLVNPEITWSGDTLCTREEGCLSVPYHYGEVERPLNVRVRYFDLDGVEHEEDFDDWDATCVQHEIDHLNGILFPEHMSRLRRDMIMKKMKKDKMLYEAEGRGDLYADANRREDF